MFSWCNLFNIFVIFSLSYQVWETDAFDQNCQPEHSKRCVLLSSLRAAFDKRTETVNQQSSFDKMQADSDDEQATLQQQLHSVNSDRLADLLDLNSEPAVEDLMRQIMSQAKLWEAIQEANREMVNQKADAATKGRERFPLTFSAQ